MQWKKITSKIRIRGLFLSIGILALLAGPLSESTLSAKSLTGPTVVAPQEVQLVVVKNHTRTRHYVIVKHRTEKIIYWQGELLRRFMSPPFEVPVGENLVVWWQCRRSLEEGMLYLRFYKANKGIKTINLRSTDNSDRIAI